MRLFVQLGFVFAMLLAYGSVAQAQRPFRRTLTQYETRVTAEIDRTIQQAMNESQELIKQDQFVPAVTRLQSILDHSEDYFLSKDFTSKASGQAGVKAQTHQIVAGLSEEGLAAYERQFGTTARDRLNEAVAANDWAKIADVISRYKMTAAGLEAMQILAAAAFDHDQLIEAAMLCEAMTTHPRIHAELSGPVLMQAAFAWHLAGQSERSEAVLHELQKMQNPKLWRIGGRTVTPLANDQDARKWLQTHFGPSIRPVVATVQQWSLPRGGLSGNESAAAACAAGGGAWSISPLRYTRFMTGDDDNLRTQREFATLSQQIEQALRDDSRLTQPAAVPVVVGDVVVYRTLNDVTAVHLRTGQLLWRSSMTDSMLAWLFQSPSNGADNIAASAPTTFPGYLRHKLFRDQLSGSLTSDGRVLYAIEESESQFNALRPRMRQGGLRYIPDPANKLVAYDLQGGRLLWEVGGVRGTPPAELSSIFFVCPPVPFDGRLYCLAEVRDELCVLALIPDGDSVKLEWSQTLINLFDLDGVIPPRRLAGSMPAIADGMLVCPTTSGAIVAFDLLQKQLRWGYAYESPRNRTPQDVFEQMTLFQIDEEEGRWLDGTPLVSAGRVIVTPRDSAEIHCLSLVDGSLIWKRPRDSGLYAACIHEDKVIVVGRTQIAAYSMADGTDAWTESVEIPEPSGRGIRSGSHYLLPLSTGEIATLDLTAGRLLGRSQLPDRQIPGNLAIGSGTLISLGVQDVIGFRPLADVQQQIARQLQEDPQQADALALRGELRLHQGEQLAAIQDLRNSLRLQPQPRVERTLASTMLVALKNDPAGILKAAPELERMTTDPRQRIEFLRLYAKALFESKDRAGAVRQLFRLTAMPQLSDDLIVVGRGYAVSQEQSVRSQLLSMDESASPAERDQITSELTHEFKSAQAAENHDQRLAQFAKLTLGMPVADRLLINLSDDKQGLDNDVTRVRLLERLTRSKVSSVAATALTTLADRSLSAKQPREAIGWIDDLKSRFPNEIGIEGKTVRELTESWLSREDVREAISTESVWPAGTIDVERSRRAQNQSTCAVDVVTHVGHHFVGWSFELENTGVLTARDRSMRIAWRLQFANPAEFLRSQPGQLHIRGRHMAFSQGMILAAIESNDLDPTPKVLFEKSLRSTSPVDRRMREVMTERRRLPNGRRFQSAFDTRGPAGFLVGLSDEAVFYQLDARLYAVDLETGRTLWTRSGTEFAKSDATVDQLLALHTNKNEAILVRPVDGTIVTRHTGSLAEMPVWFGGTRRLSRRLEERLILEMRDFNGDRVVWQSEYPAGTEVAVVEGNELSTLEPSGKLTILNLATGATVVTADLPISRAHGSAGVLAVQHCNGRYIAVAGVSAKKTETRTVTTLEQIGIAAEKAFTVDGCVSALDDKDGHLLWSVPVDQTAFDYTQSSRWPVLVLAAKYSEFDQLGRFQLMPRLTALVLDKRTGKTVYETEETSPISRSPQFTPLIDERKLIIDFQSWNLELAFPGDPKAK